jgi:tyrosyl-tRNA synthetase
MSTNQLTSTKTQRFSVLNLTSVAASTTTESIPSSAPSTSSATASASTGALKSDEYDGLKQSTLSVAERVQLAMSVGEEVITEPELTALFTARDHPIVYDGFEPSGRMHIAQGVLRAINVNKLTQCGCLFKFWVADWFAQLNNKMGGDLKKIQEVGMYMIEIWKVIGMDMTNVRFLWASEEINNHANEYWGRVMEIARMNNLPRIQRCCTIMGRKDNEEMTAAQIFYPCMQCADVFFLKADICQLGLDQRKVNMLARYSSLSLSLYLPELCLSVCLTHDFTLSVPVSPENMPKIRRCASVPSSSPITCSWD